MTTTARVPQEAPCEVARSDEVGDLALGEGRGVYTPSNDHIVGSITHGCGARWSGRRVAHCASCHLSFSGDTAFEDHRRGFECVDPAPATRRDGSLRFQLRHEKGGAPIWGLPGTWKPEGR